MADEPASSPPVVAIVAPEPVEPSAASVKSSRFRDRLGGLLVGGFLGSMLVMFFVGIPEANTQIVTYMIGQLSGFAASVVAFHYTMNSANIRATENTGRALDAIAAAQQQGNSTKT
jgi:hypothetical protein